MVSKGKINLVAPTKVSSFGEDGRSIITSDGRVLEADAVVLCTGFLSSWNKIFDSKIPTISFTNFRNKMSFQSLPWKKSELSDEVSDQR